ncbi:hypothetical protein [Bartonella sp. TT67HLJMS]|uniref:hypothetical protein n=1 Tax=Bartonella sp. TT67HLJMS TaxID=3243582 RepID=UPI0035CF5FBC
MASLAVVRACPLFAAAVSATFFTSPITCLASSKALLVCSESVFASPAVALASLASVKAVSTVP